MSKFTLWRSENKSFPTEVLVGTKFVPIESDYRVALKILHLQGDSTVREVKKIGYMLKWFYSEGLDGVEVGKAIEVMVDFLAFSSKNRDSGFVQKVSQKSESKGSKYCFEFDAEEIYVSFLQDYNIDLIDSNTKLHWYKFIMLFGNLSKETALMRKIELRTLDLSPYKGKDKVKLQRAQKEVQIPIKLTMQEASLVEDVMRKLHS